LPCPATSVDSPTKAGRNFKFGLVGDELDDVAGAIQHSSALGKDKDKLTQPDRNQAARCLQHARWERKQEGAGKFRGNWYYVRAKKT
jgi:hypothetical protein